MKAGTLIGLASTLVRKRKFKLVVVGLQFAYMGYRYLKNKKKLNQ
ncbi:hypothetical protein [Aggregatimonas sangjinii]|nr:hypothetical protein [Aggregatimonas sangjinii]